MSPEFTIIALNIVIIAVAYFVVYPRMVGSDLNKLMINDAVASLLAVLVAGSVYWGSDYAFNAVVADLNWFWFTFLTYAVLECPLLMWYLKRNNISLS